MQFEVAKKDLVSLLSKAQNIVEKRNTMPVLLNVLIEADAQSARIFATDLEVSLTDSCPVISATPGRIVVGARSLFELVKELEDGPIVILKKDNNWIEVRQRRSVFNLVGLSPDEYPIFPGFTTVDFARMPGEVLADMIDKTAYSISNDETRYYLNGVHLEKVDAEKQFFRMVATDGFRLSIVEREIQSEDSVPHTSFPSAGIIIPRKALLEIRKHLESHSGPVEFAVEGSQLVTRFSTATLLIRLIEGRFPNYQQFIPQKISTSLSFRRTELLASLKRVSLLSNQKYKGVTLSLTPGKLEISSNNPDLGDAKEELEASTYDGKDFRIGFNARYVLDVLGSFDEECVDVEFSDQLSPGLLRPHDDKRYTCVVMPMRI